jgi:hypothetical protein
VLFVSSYDVIVSDESCTATFPVPGTVRCFVVLLQDAFHNGTREKLIYVPCIIPDQKSRPDYLATVDVDPESSTYSQVLYTHG